MITVAELESNASSLANARGAQFAATASGFAIQLDQDYFLSKGEMGPAGWVSGKPSEPRQSPWWGTGNGFHPAGTGNPAGIITHEYGHAVQAYLEFRAPPKVRRAFSEWVHAEFDGAAPISRYGAKNAGENFAETFAVAFTPGARSSSPLPGSLKKFLTDNGVFKP
jgi:hypothetical protein